MILKRCCPLSATVTILTIFKIITIGCLYPLQRITAILPVHQIIRFQNGSSGKNVHSSGYHVVHITYTDYIRIREITEDNGIGICSIPIITMRLISEIGTRIILLCIFLIPVVSGPRASFRISQESVCLSFGRWSIFKFCQQIGTRKNKPAHIARIIYNMFHIRSKTRTAKCTGMGFPP